MTVENCKVNDCCKRDLLYEIERLRTALREITDLCKREPANPFLADKMDRVAIAALSSG